MFTRLKLQGYRCLADVDLELRPLNVFIGANGSGKSSLLDLFDLLSRAARGELSKAITERGGLHALLTSLRTRRADELVVALSWSQVPGTTPGTYTLSLAPLSGLGYASREVTPFSAPRARTAGKGNRAALQARALDRMLREEGELADLRADERLRHVREALAASERCWVVDVRSRAPIRWPQDLQPAQFMPGQDAETLVSALYNLRTNEPAVFNRIVDTLRAGFSEFETLDFPLAAAGRATFVWKAAVLTRGLYPHEISDGMLRFLWLTTLLLSPQLPPLITLDEPEVSLHPQLLMLLAGMLQEASMRSQLLVATHSPELIRWLAPAEVVVLDMEDGVASAKRGDDPSFNIEEWLKDYTLGEAWVKGVLGGRT